MKKPTKKIKTSQVFISHSKRKQNWLKHLKQFILVISLLNLIVGLLWLLQETNALPRDTYRRSVITPVGNLTVGLEDEGDIGTIQIGQYVNRQISVTNKGSMKQFVRVMMFPKMETSTGLMTHLTNTDLTKNLNQLDWQEGEDGYYYYLKALPAGSTTESLIDELTVPYSKESGTLTLIVKAESTTTAGKEYRQAFWGNKEEPKQNSLKIIDQQLNLQSD